jgi:hypothetical protein
MDKRERGERRRVPFAAQLPQRRSRRPAVGHQAIAEPVQGFMTSFPDLTLSMDGIETDGQKARFGWTLTSTNTGPEGTGNRVSISG